jgi:hypothetical protein
VPELRNAFRYIAPFYNYERVLVMGYHGTYRIPGLCRRGNPKVSVVAMGSQRPLDLATLPLSLLDIQNLLDAMIERGKCLCLTK